jgi:DNA modification methylase/ParB-like chromosome segregation protein Spo0J
MRIVAISEITVPSDRQRREFNEVQMVELMESIERLGLMQPIVVRYDDEQVPTLVAGERRLRAIQDLHATGGQLRCDNSLVAEGYIPTIDIGDLDPIAAYEAELEENIRRANLTWQEEAAARAELHRLRVAQNPKQTIADTAAELEGRGDGFYGAKVKRQLTVAGHLSDPEVSKAKDVKEAFKIIERKEQVRENEKLAAIVGETYGAHSHTLLMGDCLETMGSLDQASFDVICTDPPYGMGADEFGDAAGKLVSINHQYSDSLGEFQRLMLNCVYHFNRLAKPEAHLYICCDIDQFHWLKDTFGKTWNVFRTPLINYKTGSGRVPLPEHGPRRCSEYILYAHRGGKRVTGIYPDVITTAGDENLGHGAQKPVALISDLLKRSVKPGDRVLDPFVGTGTIFDAAHAHKVRATGIEREANYFGIAARRLEALDGPSQR